MTTPPPLARPLIAAGVLYQDEQGRALLVKPVYKDGWDLPGGYVEPGESPHSAAAREVLEELGVALPVGRLLVVDWAPHPVEGDKVLFIFDGGQITAKQYAAIRLQADEIDDAGLHPYDTLANLLPERLERRVGLALSAAQDSRTVYAEHGATIMADNPPTKRAT